MQTEHPVRQKRFRPDSRTVVLSMANVLFLLVCAMPALYMFGSSFVGRDGGFTLGSYSRIIAEPRQRGLLLTSATLGFGSAFLATVLGAPLGILLARGDVPFRRIVRVLLSIPLVIPPYVLALSWILLTGPGGVFARIVGKDILSSYTYNPFAAALVLGVAFYPIVMLATEAAARRVNGRLEEAGRLVIPHRSVFLKITLRLLAPTVAASALIVFVLSISEFGVPGLLRVRVFTTEVFTAFAALYDFGAATALALPLCSIAASVISSLPRRSFQPSPETRNSTLTQSTPRGETCEPRQTIPLGNLSTASARGSDLPSRFGHRLWLRRRRRAIPQATGSRWRQR
jgi:iron(III) transport system permease protein